MGQQGHVAHVGRAGLSVGPGYARRAIPTIGPQEAVAHRALFTERPAQENTNRLSFSPFCGSIASPLAACVPCVLKTTQDVVLVLSMMHVLFSGSSSSSNCNVDVYTSELYFLPFLVTGVVLRMCVFCPPLCLLSTAHALCMMIVSNIYHPQHPACSIFCTWCVCAPPRACCYVYPIAGCLSGCVCITKVTRVRFALQHRLHADDDDDD